MFSNLQPSDELVFQEILSSVSFGNQQVDLHDYVDTNLPTSKAMKRHRDLSSSKPTSAGGVEDEHTQRKLVHREIEKKRRKELADLYASLRALLPLEFIKGKRSVSDHIHQAANYINHLEENIRVLRLKRDQLNKFTSTALVTDVNTVTISSCNGRSLEIVIDVEDGFPLSPLLKAIVQGGFYIITCTSTKVNQRLLHSIRSEASSATTTDLLTLQEILAAIANNRPNFN